MFTRTNQQTAISSNQGIVYSHAKAPTPGAPTTKTNLRNTVSPRTSKIQEVTCHTMPFQRTKAKAKLNNRHLSIHTQDKNIKKKKAYGGSLYFLFSFSVNLKLL